MHPDRLAEIIAQIRYHHRQRVFVMEQRKRMDLALGSFLRLQLGWRKDGDEAANKRARDLAATLIELGEYEVAGKIRISEEPAWHEWRELILASVSARRPFDAVEADATKEMERLAKALPVWQWAEPISGFGARSLAVIVAEAGDLSAYPKKGHLWKRMGVAVIDGRRQGGLSKGAKADDWIEHGYNRMRRSRLFVIGDVMVKSKSVYRDVYLKRLVVEHAKAVERGLTPSTTTKATVESWQNRGLPELVLVRKATEQHIGAGHLANRARRYMEKRLLKDLWQAWKRGSTEPHKMAA